MPTTSHLQPDWVAEAIFYQIFPERFANGDPSNDPPGVAPWGDLPTRTNFFGGDLQGILERLDYLQELGVNALYLNPIFDSPSNHKYDTRDYFAVDPAFGDMALLKRLVDELHRRGMRAILDGVFNHCGKQFAPFQDLILNGSASKYRDWFQVRAFPVTEEPLSYMTCGGAPFLPKFNHRNPEVRQFLLKVARYWVEEAGIDGWRLDVPFKVPFDFWREFRQALRALKPDLYLVGEVWRDPHPWVAGSDIFDGVTNYTLRDLLLDYAHTKFLDAEDFAFETGQLAARLGAAQSGMLNLLGSHDTPRILSLLRGDLDLLRIVCTYLFTSPGAPLIYYGDEVGMLGENDPDCRRTMVWGAARWNPRVVELYRQLIDLRRAHPALRRGVRRTLLTFNGVFAYKMSLKEDEVIVVLNPREALPQVRLETGSSRVAWRELSGGREVRASQGEISMEVVPARSALVLAPVR